MSGDESDAETRLAQEVTLRAIRRLDILEWVMIGGALILALLGGALVALVLDGMVPWGFRAVWAAASLLLFGLPAAVTLIRVRREEARIREKLNESNDENHG
mgnify:CR=1 FL=1